MSVADGYSSQEKPLAAYAALTLAFNTALGATLLAAHRRRGLCTPSARDVLLLGVATHKFSRLVAKDRVTSFVRAPFVEYEESSGHGEVEESPRGRGLRRAVGELLVCPFCVGQWVAGGFVSGLQLAPRATRVVGSIFAALSLADFVQLGYGAARRRS